MPDNYSHARLTTNATKGTKHKMKTATLIKFREYMAQMSPDFIVLRRHDDSFDYQDAVAAFGRTGNRATLIRKLMLLGLFAADIRWHVANPGLLRGTATAS